MSSAMTVLPPKVAAIPSVQRITNALTATRARNQQLRKEAEGAQSPVEQTIGVQGGAAAAAVITVFAPPQHRPMALALASGLALAYGLSTGTPAAVSAANGILAPYTFSKVVEMLTAKPPAPATAPEPNPAG